MVSISRRNQQDYEKSCFNTHQTIKGLGLSLYFDEGLLLINCYVSRIRSISVSEAPENCGFKERITFEDKHFVYCRNKMKVAFNL